MASIKMIVVIFFAALATQFQHHVDHCWLLMILHINAEVNEPHAAMENSLWKNWKFVIVKLNGEKIAHILYLISIVSS